MNEDKVFAQFENGIIYNGEALEVLKTLPDKSINCCVTSPPYYNLRNYGTATWEGGNPDCEHLGAKVKSRFDYSLDSSPIQDGKRTGTDAPKYKDVCPDCGAVKVDKQIGMENSYNDYINNLCNILDEVKRVLRDDGCCYVNIGDSYSTSHESGTTDAEKGWKGGAAGGERQRHHGRANGGDIPTKSLMQIPFRFSIEMSNRGWILRNTIIWHKKSCMPSSVSDRFTVDFEYVFFFTKNKNYYFETQYEPYSQSYLTDSRHTNGTPEHNNVKDYESNGVQTPTNIHDNSYGKLGEGRIKRCVWSVNPQPFRESHFATYPPELIRTPIRASVPDFVCKNCGKPREKIVEIIPGDERSHEGRTHSTEEQRMGKTPPPYKGWMTEKIDKGLTDCGCNAGFEPGVVLDPFFGAGTTAIEAENQHKKWIGIELNPEYCGIAKKRINNHTAEYEAF